MTASVATAAPGPLGRLGLLEEVALEASAPEVATEARDLSDRVAQGRFYVACVGQFKRGKSTLLNALVGRSVLPTGVVPVTSAVTVIRHGPAVAARAWFADGRCLALDPGEIGEYVSEGANPGNVKGVRAVEVFVPSALLEHGMCLVDTPGLGSVIDENSEVTRRFVPHVDAAILVVGADPPVSADEAALAERLAEHVHHLVIVLNKADRVADADVEEAARFTAQVLASRLHRPIGTIHRVSASERLALGRPTRDWDPFERNLGSLGSEAGSDLVLAAERRGIVRLARALEGELAERRTALLRPVEESERRLDDLRRSVVGAERALTDLGVLLVAEEGRLREAFRERQQVFLSDAQAGARAELLAGIRALRVPRRKLRQRSYDLAREVAGRTVEAWKAKVEPVAVEMYRTSVDRFVLLANEFLARVATSGEPGMEALPRALEPESGFRVGSGLYYTHLMYMTTNTLPWLLDLVRSRPRTERALLHKVGGYLDRILEANSSRVANDLGERVSASRTRLQAQVRSALQRVVTVAERAIESARARRAEGEAAVEAELARIETLQRRTASLLDANQEGERTWP